MSTKEPRVANAAGVDARRWAGAGLIVGASALGAAILLVATRPTTDARFSPIEAALFLSAGALLVLSLPAVYAAQAREGGPLALWGHVLLETGTLLFVLLAAPALLFPTLDPRLNDAVVLFVLALALTVGLLATGVATIRAGVFPRGAPILVLVAMVGFAFGFFVSEFLPPVVGQITTAATGIVLAAGFGWMGIVLWRGTAERRA